MESFFGLFIFILGLIVGSFLNVVIYRYKTGRGSGGRSFCLSCGKILKALELIPVISFLALSGKCSSCKSKISWQYPLVELATGILFFATFLKLYNSLPELSILALPYHFAIISILMVVVVYDIKHKIIPDELSFLFAFLSLGALLVSVPLEGLFLFPQILDTLSGIFLSIPFALLWVISSGRWMGLGDAKLVLGIGWFLGFSSGLSAIILGFWIGAVWSIVAIILEKINHKKKGLNLKSEIPFAPFLILGTLLSFFFEFDIFRIHDIFNF